MENYKQSGQTLIETLVAIFVMVMAITSALGLATYSLSAQTNVNKQIIGTGLAREGIEAVKNMRDTNWLRDVLQTNCYDFTTSSNVGNCYSNWENNSAAGWYNFKPNPVGGQSFLLNFTGAATNNQKFWTPSGAAANFALDLDNTAGITTGHLYAPAVGAKGTSDYFREIFIKEISNAPFLSANNYQIVDVQSRVWWKGKNCATAATYAASNKTCRVQLESYLINWKNY